MHGMLGASPSPPLAAIVNLTPTSNRKLGDRLGEELGENERKIP